MAIISEMVNYDLIGKHIQEMRQARGLTQADLAEICDLSVQYISYLENGNKHPGLETLLKLASALGTTVDALLLGNQPKDRLAYQREIKEILDDCDESERRYFLYALRQLKDGFRILKTK